MPTESSPGGAQGREPACQCRRHKRHRFYPWVGKISWRGKWQPTPGLLPGESHGQRSLAGSRPWSHAEPDRTKAIWHAHNRKGEFPLHWGHTGWSRPRRPPLHMPPAGVKLQADLDFRAGWPWKLPGVRHGVGAGVGGCRQLPGHQGTRAGLLSGSRI